jgi:hypothetical protein
MPSAKPPVATQATQLDRMKADFRVFLYVVYEHLGTYRPTQIQYEIAHFMQHGPDRLMVKGFRGMGKSWIAAAFALWTLLNNPDANVLVYSAAKVRSDAFTTFCLQLIDEMSVLAHLRPRDGQRRSMVSFDVGPARANQTPSMLSTGIFGTATGMRADLIIPDDVEVPNNSETLLQREKLAERTKEFEAILKPGGRIVYLGTDQTEDSIYRDLPEREYAVRIWPARYPDPILRDAYQGALSPTIAAALDADPTLVGKPTEPTRFTEEKLRKAELGGGRAWFALQFMLDPRLSDEDLYPLKLRDLVIHSLDMEVAPEKLIWSASPEYVIQDLPNVGLRGDRLHRGIMLQGDKTPHVAYNGTVMGIDPAGRGKDETGYAVVSVVNGMMYLRDSGAVKGYEESELLKLAAAAKKYKVNHVVCEPNFGDGMFTQTLARVMNTVYPVKVEDAERAMNQKEKRIIDILEPVLTSHRLVVDRDLVRRDYESTSHLPPEKAVKYRLFYQLTRITKQKASLDHDDRLEALAIAVRYWGRVVGTDVEDMAKRSRAKALDMELRKFMQHATGAKPRAKTWAHTGHG